MKPVKILGQRYRNIYFIGFTIEIKIICINILNTMHIKSEHLAKIYNLNVFCSSILIGLLYNFDMNHIGYEQADELMYSHKNL